MSIIGLHEGSVVVGAVGVGGFAHGLDPASVGGVLGGVWVARH